MKNEKYKQKLLAFLKFKNEKIKSLVEIDYMTPEDFEEVESWSEDICEAIWKEIYPIDDSNSCPWCIKRDFDFKECMFCGYGKRNGICADHEKNKYNQIKMKAQSLGIEKIFYLEEICNYFLKL